MLNVIDAHALIKFKLMNIKSGDLYPIHQIAKLKTSPKFPAIQYAYKLCNHCELYGTSNNLEAADNVIHILLLEQGSL